jgi:oligo-1,6-glucosidase
MPALAGMQRSHGGRAPGYQIYPESFCDSNGDGIGDIPGIISKLDYLAELGIGFIWLSPVYASPMIDNGYDISDYQAIHPQFGTHGRYGSPDLRSESAENRDRDGSGGQSHLGPASMVQGGPQCPYSPYRDYYLWREALPAKGDPADMQASFGGSAWTKDMASGDFYFHLVRTAATRPQLG